MKVKAVDMQYLKYLSSFSKRNTSEIDQVIKLFQERKIERFDTARSIIDNLSSGGKKKQKAGNNISQDKDNTLRKPHPHRLILIMAREAKPTS